jgi:hypothetical protein
MRDGSRFNIRVAKRSARMCVIFPSVEQALFPLDNLSTLIPVKRDGNFSLSRDSLSLFRERAGREHSTGNLDRTHRRISAGPFLQET